MRVSGQVNKKVISTAFIGAIVDKMKYYTYIEPTSAEDMTPLYITMSEEEILKEYWEYWYGKMCAKFGQEHVDANYSTKECIEDWCVVHWAQESDCDR
jgi:hypothetical protein